MDISFINVNIPYRVISLFSKLLLHLLFFKIILSPKRHILGSIICTLDVAVLRSEKSNFLFGTVLILRCLAYFDTEQQREGVYSEGFYCSAVYV